MRRAAASIALIVAALALALAAPPALAHKAKLKGKVADTTCYGPCIVHSDPPLYTGVDVRIVIRRVADRKRIKAVTPDAGRFGIRLRPARYELTPKFEDPCGQGAAVTTRVRRSQVNKVEIDVHNRCVLALSLDP